MSIPWNKVTWYTKLGAVVVIATAIALGFYFWNEYKDIQALKSSLSVDLPQDNQATEEIDTSDWQAYRNEKYEFEVMYPSYSQPMENVNSDGIFFNIVSIDLPLQKGTTLQSHFTVSLVSSQYWPGCTESFDQDELERRVGNMTIDGVDFAQYENSTFQDTYKSDTYVAQVDSTCFAITAFASRSADEAKDRQILDQILSTFRFIEPITAIGTSDWKTYRNAKYGFEIKYPEEFEVNFAGPTKRSADRLNIRELEIYDCEKWLVAGWVVDFGGVLGQPGNVEVLGGNEVIVHFDHFPSVTGYTHYYEFRRDDCTDLLFTFSSTDTNDPTEAQKRMFNQIIATLKFVGEDEAALWTDCVDEEGGVPVITSVSPGSGSVGTEFEVRGCNFAGFEGDLYIWIQNSQGEGALLYGGVESTSKYIDITLRSPLCQVDNSYSGIPCGDDEWLTLTPGAYKILTTPWGERSNEVDFTIE